MTKFLIILCVVISLVSCLEHKYLTPIVSIPPATVSSIVLESYLGTWYQTFASLIPNQTFERGGVCLNATYGFVSDTEFSVINYQNQGSPTGPSSFVTGKATLSDPNELGKWNLQLLTSFGMTTYGNYWIVKLGPIHHTTNLYEYSVVSVPMGTQLFVLARDVTDFQTNYQTELLQELQVEGFPKLFPTYQGADCHT